MKAEDLCKRLTQNLCGGRGICKHCGKWHNNVAYHEACQCPKRPDRYAERLMGVVQENGWTNLSFTVFPDYTGKLPDALKEVTEALEGFSKDLKDGKVIPDDDIRL